MKSSLSFPWLMVAVAGSPQQKARILSRVGGALRKRGLNAHVMKSPGSALVGCEVLLVGCDAKKTNTLVGQIEKLWTQKWNKWYAMKSRLS